MLLCVVWPDERGVEFRRLGSGVLRFHSAKNEEMITHLVAVSITLLLNIPRWEWEKAHQPETGVSYFAGLIHCVTVIDRKKEVLGCY